MEKPDIVISTPRRLMAHLEAGNITLKHSLEMLVIDEADLIFSFGHEEDFKKLVAFLPKIYQAMLMSATLTDEVLDIKQLVLHNAVSKRRTAVLSSVVWIKVEVGGVSSVYKS